MNKSAQKSIRLVVNDEQALYTPFSPEDEFSDPVKSYIRSKLAGDSEFHSIDMIVIAREHLDEEKFRSAVTGWIRDEEALFRQNEKNTVRMLAGLIVVGSIFIILSLFLQSRIELLRYSLLPILGSLALGRSAHILIIDMPIIRAKRRIINDVVKNSTITFEYGDEHE